MSLKKTAFIGIAVILACLLALPVANAIAGYKGWILDAETKEPVEGAVVFIEFDSVGFPGGGSYYVNATEVRSDDKGYFSLPFKGWSFNLFGMLFTRPQVTIFRSGYKPIIGNWGNFLDVNWGEGSSMGKPILKVEYGKPYILLKKYKSLEEMIKDRLNGFILKQDMSPGSDVKPEKWKLLQEELNKEHELLFQKK